MQVGSHELNLDSSRSHCILTTSMEQDIVDPIDGHTRTVRGKMTFVDLAGSERLKETKSAGVMLKETGNINRSLYAADSFSLSHTHSLILPLSSLAFRMHQNG